MYRKIDVPFELYEVLILDADDDQLVKISKELGLALNLDEMKRIKDYFRKKGRNPYDIELQSIAQAWSEHCCYKSSKYYLRQYLFEASKADYVIQPLKKMQELLNSMKSTPTSQHLKATTTPQQ